ncbi:MAG: dihydrodipicolinate synthase family protein [Candidatus Nanohaloarchaea archaeon]
MDEIRGVYPAMPTAMDEDFRINYEAMEQLIDYLEAGGVEGLVPAGCTGHAPTLGDMSEEELYDEHVRYVSEISEMTDLPVIAGDGMNSTTQTIELAGAVEDEADIDAHLVITPYQNKPPQDRLISHYEDVAASLEEPLTAYNVPSRTGVNIEPRTLESIADIPGVIGIKEASNDPDQIREIGSRLGEQEDFAIGSGDDPRNPLIFEQGGEFAISVSANIYPEAIVEVFEEGVENRDHDAARERNRDLEPLHEAMFQEGETNPISVQYALDELIGGFGTQRAPLDRRPLEGYDEAHNQIFTNRTEIQHVIDHYDLDQNLQENLQQGAVSAQNF